MKKADKQGKGNNCTDIIQAVCAIISVIFIGGISILIMNKANEIADKQTHLMRLSAIPYFTIEEIKTEDLNRYIVHNEGGYIENTTVTLTRIMQLKNIMTGDEACIPYRENQINFYDLKDNSFEIESPSDIKGIIKLGEMYETYFATEKGIWVSSYYFDMLEINYLDTTHTAKSNKYLIGNNNNNKVCFLVPLNEELNANILSNIPLEL